MERKEIEVGSKVIVNGYVGTATVTRLVGRTVEAELTIGKVSVDRDSVIAL